MKKVPKAKASTSGHSGWPLVAIHIAHRVGYNSSSVPMGLSARISRQ